MAAAIRSQLRSGQSQLRIQLVPPRLGRLDLRMSLRGSVLSLSIGVETNTVRHLISSGALELRESLREAGLEMERMRVTVEREEKPTFQGDGRSGAEGGRTFAGGGSAGGDRDDGGEGAESMAGATAEGGGAETLPAPATRAGGIDFQA
jgi:flagellar hook-length control protein FliK